MQQVVPITRASSPGSTASSTRLRWSSLQVLHGLPALVAGLVVWQLIVLLPISASFAIPGPLDVAREWLKLLQLERYWAAWHATVQRVLVGFAVAQLIGIPLALAMAWSRLVHDFTFPVFELLRPIPPLGWVPLAILFWPTTELSVVSIIFLGAFFTIVTNVHNAARRIDPTYIRAARSMGARGRHLLWRIVLPAMAPAIVTGMTVGIGVTWDVVIAAEIIARGQGLGRMTWEAYINGNLAEIIVGMGSVAIAGLVSSLVIRRIALLCLPWLGEWR